MSNETMLTRRGLFMKIGMLFNGLVGTALAVPIVVMAIAYILIGKYRPRQDAPSVSAGLVGQSGATS